MEKKEILAEFDGFIKKKHYLGGFVYERSDKMGIYGGVGIAFKYDTDRNEFHPVWEKFRDLKFEDDGSRPLYDHSIWVSKIAERITYGTLQEAFDELVRGIKWYNEIKEK